MTKREEIDQLKHDLFMLSQRVAALEQRDTSGKSFKQIQEDWNNRHNTTPLPCNHKPGRVGRMTVGDNGG